MERHGRKNVKEKKRKKEKKKREKKEERETWRRVLEDRVNNIEKRYEIKEEEK